MTPERSWQIANSILDTHRELIDQWANRKRGNTSAASMRVNT